MADASELAAAAAAGDLATVRAILAAAPALLNARDPEGAIALHYAAQSGRQEVVRWLVAHGVTPLWPRGASSTMRGRRAAAPRPPVSPSPEENVHGP